jgi:hypothetical protein
VPGDVEAFTEFRIEVLDTGSPSPQTVGYYLGCYPADETFDPADVFWCDFDDTVDGNSSGGQYGTESVVGTPGTAGFLATCSANGYTNLRGRVQFLARFRADGDVTVTPFYDFLSDTRVLGDATAVASGATFLLYDLMDMMIDWHSSQDPDNIRVGIRVDSASGDPDADLDFLMLMPYYHTLLASGDMDSYPSGVELRVHGQEAYLWGTASNALVKYIEHRGPEINVEPNKYNYIFLLYTGVDNVWDIDDTMDMAVYITPRWLMPGPPL